MASHKQQIKIIIHHLNKETREYILLMKDNFSIGEWMWNYLYISNSTYLLGMFKVSLLDDEVTRHEK